MDKYEMAEKLCLLLDCAENDIQIADITGFEGRYSILSNGLVWSHLSGKFLSPGKNAKGYLFVRLTDGTGLSYTKRVHRLVAEAFCEKPEEWDESWDAAHLDDNPANNDSINIQWQSRSQNLDTDHWRELSKTKIFASVRCVETGEVFPSLAAAGRSIDKNPYGINMCILGKQKTCGGYHWERVGENKILCVETEEVYPTLGKAAEAVNGDPSAIAKCAKGERKTHKGYHWRYADAD